MALRSRPPAHREEQDGRRPESPIRAEAGTQADPTAGGDCPAPARPKVGRPVDGRIVTKNRDRKIHTPRNVGVAGGILERIASAAPCVAPCWAAASAAGWGFARRCFAPCPARPVLAAASARLGGFWSSGFRPSALLVRGSRFWQGAPQSFAVTSLSQHSRAGLSGLHGPRRSHASRLEGGACRQGRRARLAGISGIPGGPVTPSPCRRLPARQRTRTS